MQLIDKTAAYNALKYEAKTTWGLSFTAEAFGKAARIIDQMPTVEVEPARHGRWIMLVPYGALHTQRRKCSECGEIKAQELTNFCPNCGARMAQTGGERRWRN